VHKPWFDKVLLNLSRINCNGCKIQVKMDGNKFNNAGCENSKYSGMEGRYMKDKITQLKTNNTIILQAWIEL